MSKNTYSNDSLGNILSAIISAMVTAVSITMQPAFVQGMVDFIGIGEVEAGYVASAEVLGLMAGTLIFAFIAPLLNWRHLLVVSFVTIIVGNVLTIFAGNAQTLTGLRAISGLGAGFVTAIGFASLANTEKPGRNYGWLVACVIGFSAVGFAGLPAIFALGGYHALIGGYTIAVLLCLPAVLWISTGHLESEKEVSFASSSEKGGAVAGALGLVAVLLFFVGYACVWTYMALIGRDAGLNDAQIAFVLSSTQCFGIAGALSIAFLYERVRHRWLAAAILGSGILGIFALMLDLSYVLFFALNASFQYCWNAGQPLLLSIIASRQSNGKLLRFAIPLQFMGMGIAPSIAAMILSKNGGYDAVLVVAGGLALISLVSIQPLIQIFKTKRTGREMEKKRTILVIGTADTKSDEIRYLAERISSLGVTAKIMDVGVLEAARFPVDYTNEDVAYHADTTIQSIIDVGDENSAMTLMAQGASALTAKLYADGEVDGVIALGGSMGTDLALDVAAVLPIGVPKFVVSTIAFSPTIAINRLSPDIMMILWVGGLYGLNAACKAVLSQAAGAVAGAVRAVEKPENVKPVVGMSSLGASCLPYMKYLTPELEKRGYEVAVFHATGMGGMAIERLAEQKYFCAVLDLALCEMSNAAHGGILSSGPDRLSAAGKAGIPQILAPGASDMVDIATWLPIPDRFEGRGYHAHNRLIASVGTTSEERKKTAELICTRMSESTGVTALVLPSKGIHAWDKEGQDLYDPVSMKSYADAFRAGVPQSIEFHDLDAHICDEIFCETVLEIFDNWVEQGHIPAGRKG